MTTSISLPNASRTGHDDMLCLTTYATVFIGTAFGGAAVLIIALSVHSCRLRKRIRTQNLMSLPLTR